jgi:hypothetical protein
MQSTDGAFDRKDQSKEAKDKDSKQEGREVFVVSVALQGTSPTTIQFKLGTVDWEQSVFRFLVILSFKVSDCDSIFPILTLSSISSYL